MSWLIWEKIFTYFYNKFSPMNRMLYMKCGVNSSLHNSGCCRRCVAPWITFITTHRIHKEDDLQIHFFVIPQNKAPRTGLCHVWRTNALCPFFGREKNTEGSTVGLTILLASVCHGDS
jgi:hypothetical protein